MYKDNSEIRNFKDFLAEKLEESKETNSSAKAKKIIKKHARLFKRLEDA